MSLQDAFWAIIFIGLLLIVSRFIRQNTAMFRRIFLPSSVIAGTLALLLGPQVLGNGVRANWGDESWLANGLFPANIAGFYEEVERPVAGEVADGEERQTETRREYRTGSLWGAMPGLLISIVFAALLMGKPIPGLREIWYRAGPQVCFGQTLAWGQYVVGILLCMLVLTPMFGLPAVAGALIEIGFEGGHGTAGAMRDSFAEAGWADGADLALGLATIGLVGGVVIGTILINIAVRRGDITVPDGVKSIDDVQLYSDKVESHEIAELQRDKERESQPTDPLSLHFGLVGAAVGIGWCILEGLRWIELNTWASGEDATRFFRYVPLFPMAMIGGVIIQLIFDILGRSDLISQRLMNRISGAALDFTIIAALGTLSLQAIGDNFMPFLLLAGAGMAWCVFGVVFLAPRIIPTYWFERGVGDFGQSMGVTVTGLLLMRVADPPNKSGALESFGYKQLLFEPIVGGGLFTGASVGLIMTMGSGSVLAITAGATAFWIILGFFLFGRLAKQNRIVERANRV